MCFMLTHRIYFIIELMVERYLEMTSIPVYGQKPDDDEYWPDVKNE